MIELAQTSINIAAPINSVFSYVTNMENYKEWFPGVVEIKSANDLEHGDVGKQYKEILSLPDGDAEMIIEVHQCEKDKLFLMRGSLASLLTQMTATFAENEKGDCQIHLHYHSRNTDLTSDSEFIITLRKDLSLRASEAVVRLKEIMELQK